MAALENCGAQKVWNETNIHSGRAEFHETSCQIKCGVCNKVLSSKSSLKNHMHCHSKKKAFCCEHCGKLFSFKNNLESHLVTEHKLYGHLALTCEQCGKVFARKNALSTHMLVHQGVRPYSCHVCSRTFTQKVTRDVHLVTHTGNYPFDCQQCSRKFSSKHKLRVHSRSHDSVDTTDSLKSFRFEATENTKTYTCLIPQCPGKTKIFADYSAFVKHNQRYHNPSKQYFSCHECGFHFVERRSLKHHIAMNHTLDEPVFHRCYICNKLFTLKSKLQRHMCTHLEDPKHRCNTCGKRYYRADVLKKHEKRHRITQTTCRICEKVCQDSESLKKHVKLHVTPDQSCLQCGLTFTTRASHDYHMAKHDNKFSFVCAICRKNFVRKCHYTAHLSTHNEASVKCQTCGKVFKSESYLRRHESRMHSPA